jgi:hypothetical protein
VRKLTWFDIYVRDLFNQMTQLVGRHPLSTLLILGLLLALIAGVAFTTRPVSEVYEAVLWSGECRPARAEATSDGEHAVAWAYLAEHSTTRHCFSTEETEAAASAAVPGMVDELFTSTDPNACDNGPPAMEFLLQNLPAEEWDDFSPLVGALRAKCAVRDPCVTGDLLSDGYRWFWSARMVNAEAAPEAYRANIRRQVMVAAYISFYNVPLTADPEFYLQGYQTFTSAYPLTKEVANEVIDALMNTCKDAAYPRAVEIAVAAGLSEQAQQLAVSVLDRWTNSLGHDQSSDALVAWGRFVAGYAMFYDTEARWKLLSHVFTHGGVEVIRDLPVGAFPGDGASEDHQQVLTTLEDRWIARAEWNGNYDIAIQPDGTRVHVIHMPHAQGPLP